VRSLVGAPLLIEGRVIGVIHVETARPRHFTPDDLRLLQLAADRLALAIEHARLYEAEQKARLQAETANRVKDEFLATVSHELRSPLNAILGWVKLLREGKLDATQGARALETIERSARAQGRLISDLLDVSRIVTGQLRLNLRLIAPARFIEAAVEAVRPAAEAKGIRLEMALEAAVRPISGDSDRLQRIVWNLLSNAIKFTPGGGRVEVRLRRAGEHLEIVVSDTGAGISPEFLPQVFDRFRQADSSSTRKQGGLGLGLAIVRHLVELHQGTIRVQSPGCGQGATFVVQLPLAKDEGRQVKDEGERQQERDEAQQVATAPCTVSSVIPHPSLAGLRVLVVDDDRDAREVVATILRQAEALVRTVASAAEALAAMAEWPPDVLLSDIEMPEVDGYTLMQQVRAAEATRGGVVPAVALTAYTRLEDRLRAFASGFQMHVPKPVDPAELVTVIASLAGRLSQGGQSGAPHEQPRAQQGSVRPSRGEQSRRGLALALSEGVNSQVNVASDTPCASSVGLLGQVAPTA
jgi:signal transduction histidine kinase/DNA-binding response OmpR family regulator